MQNETTLKKEAPAPQESRATYDDLPDLGLYMDQVIGFLNRLMAPMSFGREEAPLTPSMVNNYVKSGHINRPTAKKYSREQLGALYMLCALKKNLSIPDAAALLYFLVQEEGNEGAFNRFIGEQSETLAARKAEIAQAEEKSDRAELTSLALSLILHACAERMAAEELISHLVRTEDKKNALRRRAQAEAEKALKKKQEER